jgi:hypothetical protein
VDGLVTTDDEVRKLMLDREAWRSWIKMIIVAANKKVYSSKREDRSTIRRTKTGSAIVDI